MINPWAVPGVVPYVGVSTVLHPDADAMYLVQRSKLAPVIPVSPQLFDAMSKLVLAAVQ